MLSYAADEGGAHRPCVEDARALRRTARARPATSSRPASSWAPSADLPLEQLEQGRLLLRPYRKIDDNEKTGALGGRRQPCPRISRSEQAKATSPGRSAVTQAALPIQLFSSVLIASPLWHTATLSAMIFNCVRVKSRFTVRTRLHTAHRPVSKCFQRHIGDNGYYRYQWPYRRGIERDCQRATHLVTFGRSRPRKPIGTALERVEEEHARTEYIDSSMRRDGTGHRSARTVANYALTSYEGDARERSRRLRRGRRYRNRRSCVRRSAVARRERDVTIALTNSRPNRWTSPPMRRRTDFIVVEHGKALRVKSRKTTWSKLETLQSDRKEENPTGGELGDRERTFLEFFELVAEKAEIVIPR